MDDKLVTIARYYDYIQAELARQTLEDFEIKAIVTGQNASNVFPGVVEGPELQVFQSQAQKAKEILDQKPEQEQ